MAINLAMYRKPAAACCARREQCPFVQPGERDMVYQMGIALYPVSKSDSKASTHLTKTPSPTSLPPRWPHEVPRLQPRHRIPLFSSGLRRYRNAARPRTFLARQGITSPGTRRPVWRRRDGEVKRAQLAHKLLVHVEWETLFRKKIKFDVPI